MQVENSEQEFMAKKVRFKGGKKLDALLKNAFKGHIKAVETGFFDNAKYEDGTPVAGVAAAHEFGDGNLPERPFFRQANGKVKDKLLNVLKSGIEPETMAVDPMLAERIGAMHAGEVQRSITELTAPALASQTIAKKGSSNPLVDAGFMRASVTHKVKK